MQLVSHPQTGPEGERSPGTSLARDDLRLRIVSGAFLGVTAVGSAWIGGAIFSAVVAFLAVIMCFEWTRMIERAELTPAFYSLAAGCAICVSAVSAGWHLAAAAICVLSGLAAYGLVQRRARFGLWVAFAALYIIAPSSALVWLRNETENGLALTIFLFAVVWTADTFAYLAGRFVGGPRLSPALSPAKTWSGAVAAVLASALMGAIFADRVFGSGNILLYAVMSGSLGLASILGDMAESAFKRVFGVKDTSGFIPGHGGVLDRLDGMIFATSAMVGVLLALGVFG